MGGRPHAGKLDTSISHHWNPKEFCPGLLPCPPAAHSSLSRSHEVHHYSTALTMKWSCNSWSRPSFIALLLTDLEKAKLTV